MDNDTVLYIILFLSVFNTIVTIYFLYHFFKIFIKLVNFLIPDNSDGNMFKYEKSFNDYDKDV